MIENAKSWQRAAMQYAMIARHCMNGKHSVAQAVLNQRLSATHYRMARIQMGLEKK